MRVLGGGSSALVPSSCIPGAGDSHNKTYGFTRAVSPTKIAAAPLRVAGPLRGPGTPVSRGAAAGGICYVALAQRCVAQGASTLDRNAPSAGVSRPGAGAASGSEPSR